MLLVLDIGNSQTSFGVFDGPKLLRHWRAETKAQRTSDEYASLLFPLLEISGLSGTRWDGVAVASVVPAANHAFRQFCREYLKQEPVFIDSLVDLGFGLSVDNPAEVGADRLANAAYAIAHLKLPAVVVDMGTATTLDVVSKDGIYEGGAILPGVRMAAEALGTRTAKLPIVDLAMPTSVIGKNTVDCIRVGILLGYCDLIDGLLDRLRLETGLEHDVALTGGFAPMLHPRLRTKARCLPDLTLEGAALLFARITRK